VNHIIKSDFPGRWPQVVDNISIYLQNQDVNGWNGALVTMYQLVKTYEYKRSEERTPLNEAMNLLLPMIYQLMVRLLAEQSEQSVLLQKQILKIYYALTQYSLPLDLITKEIFSQWMEICRQVADRAVPDSSHLDDDERTEFPYWKTKKWALHIMVRMFERCVEGMAFLVACITNSACISSVMAVLAMWLVRNTKNSPSGICQRSARASWRCSSRSWTSTATASTSRRVSLLTCSTI